MKSGLILKSPVATVVLPPFSCCSEKNMVGDFGSCRKSYLISYVHLTFAYFSTDYRLNCYGST